MEILITVIRQYAEWIYAICGFTALYNIYQTWQIRAARRQAVFTLERQKATDDLYKILFTALVLLGVMGVTYFSSNVLAEAIGLPPDDRSILDNFRQTEGTASSDLGTLGQPVDGTETGGNEGLSASEDNSATANGSSEGATNADSSTDAGGNLEASNELSETIADNDDLATSASQTDTSINQSDEAGSTTANNAVVATVPSVVGGGTLPTPAQPIPTPTFTYAPPPPPTIAPTTAPVVSAPGCPDPRTSITNPGNGSVVSGSFNIIGTVAHEQMQFYKIEYVPGTNTNQEFIYLSGGNDPIVGGVLATVDSTIWYNGAWTIKVTVVDNTGNFPPPCTVTITVSN